MQTEKLFKIGLAALVTVSIAACSSSGSDADMEDNMGAANGALSGAGTDPSAVEGARSQGIEQEPQLTREEMREQEMLQVTTFYFDFDQSELKPETREALVYHANRLKDNPNMRVRLEGHTDERGTREYNLALGERRAQSVERYMQVQGVSSRQLETISYGEEMPVASGSSESAYSRNRRVELKYE